MGEAAVDLSRTDASPDRIAVVLSAPFWFDIADPADKDNPLSCPHVTLCMVNDASSETLDAVRQAAQDVVDQFCGQNVLLGDLDYFEADDGRVAYVQALVSDDVKAARERLVSSMRTAGIPVDDTFPEWVPHMTLAHLPTAAQYAGMVPKGEWDIWGLGLRCGDDRYSVTPIRCDANAPPVQLQRTEPKPAPVVHTESRVHVSDTIIRVDAATLGAPEPVGDGWRRYPILFSRAEIVQEYEEKGKIILEYRPASEVFDPDSMASGVGVPWELRHSADLLTPDTVLGVARGAVLDVSQHEDGLHTCGPGVAWDRELFDAIEDDSARQVSVAYRCKIDRRPGTSDAGQRFDQRQTKIRWNSLAAEPLGRAGTARVLTDRLDRADVVSRADALLAIAAAGQTPTRPVYFDLSHWVRTSGPPKQTTTPRKDADSMNSLIKLLIQASGISAPDLAAALGVSEADLDATLASDMSEEMSAKFIAALGLGQPPAMAGAEDEPGAAMDAPATVTVSVDGTDYQVPQEIADKLAAMASENAAAMDRADKATKRANAATKDMVSRSDAERMADERGLALATAMSLARRVHGYEFTPESRKDAAGAEQPVNLRDWQVAAIRGAFGDQADVMLAKIEAAPAATRPALIEMRMDDAKSLLDAAEHKDGAIRAAIIGNRDKLAKTRANGEERADRLAEHKKHQKDLAAGKMPPANTSPNGA